MDKNKDKACSCTLGSLEITSVWYCLINKKNIEEVFGKMQTYEVEGIAIVDSEKVSKWF